MLGEALERGGRCDAAVAVYRAAIAAQPAGPQPYLRAGMCLTTLGRLADAAATFEQARQVAPRSSRPLLGLGTVALLEGRTADAQQLFERAIALEPQNTELGVRRLRRRPEFCRDNRLAKPARTGRRTAMLRMLRQDRSGARRRAHRPPVSSTADLPG